MNHMNQYNDSVNDSCLIPCNPALFRMFLLTQTVQEWLLRRTPPHGPEGTRAGPFGPRKICDEASGPWCGDILVTGCLYWVYIYMYIRYTYGITLDGYNLDIFHDFNENFVNFGL